MEDRNKKTEGSSGGETHKKIKTEHSGYRSSVRGKKGSRAEKTYTVTITIVQVTDEEAKIKRAIIESIMKKNYKK